MTLVLFRQMVQQKNSLGKHAVFALVPFAFATTTSVEDNAIDV